MKSVLVACFLGTWVVLGVGSFVVFVLGKDAAFKRRWFPRIVILVGVLFVLFSSAIMVSDGQISQLPAMLILILPMICLISYLNMRFTKFCGNCGKTLYSQNWFAPLIYCSACGAKIDTKPKSDDRFLE